MTMLRLISNGHGTVIELRTLTFDRQVLCRFLTEKKIIMGIAMKEERDDFSS